MEEKKKKKAYVKPEMHVEEFTPNEYIATCAFTGSCILSCDYGSGRDGTKVQGQKNTWADPSGNWHGSPCASMSVKADGNTITGQENGKNVQIQNVKGVDWNNVPTGEWINGISWQSVDKTAYDHKGQIYFSEYTSKPNVS